MVRAKWCVMRRLLILAVAIAAPAASFAATVPGALAEVTGGLWEISGAPDPPSPIRQCITNVLVLAQFEHRNRNCSREVLSDRGTSTVINYSCGPSDFGQSEIDVITPRLLRISTQGISRQLPFNYVIEARRVGDCSNDASPSHH